MKNFNDDFISKTIVPEDAQESANEQEGYRYKAIDGFMSRFFLIIASIATVAMLGGFVFCVLNVHKFSGWAAVGTFACSLICLTVSCFFWKTLPKDVKKIFDRFPVKSYDEYKEEE